MRINRSEFDSTMRIYRQLSKRDPAEICNTKAFYIARRAVLETPKANKGDIKNSLGRISRRGGKTRLNLKRGTNSGNEEAPLAALIIQARAVAKGERSPFFGKTRAEGAAMMKVLIEALLAARIKSIAFLKSGWLPAIKALAPLVKNTRGAAREDRSASQVGQSKGSASPAKDSLLKVHATIINAASATRDTKEALIKFGEPALQRAFDFETQSMLKYIEDKYRQSAEQAGIKTKH